MASEEDPGRRFVVRIPSYTEVLELERPSPPTDLFRPSSSNLQSGGFSSESKSDFRAGAQPSSSSGSPVQEIATGGRPICFTEAFSFVKSTKSYAAPPVPAHIPATAPIQGGGVSAQKLTNPDSAAAPSPSQARNAIIVSRRQQGNPILKHIRNVRWVFGDIVPDYMLGQTSCALYISLRYHLLHPEYLFFRIRELQKSYRLRAVLCHVDLEDVIKPLHEITKTAVLHDCSLICAWSVEECARYLETLKTYENKPADSIQERTDSDYLSRLTSALTTVRHVNKTDVVTLGATFGTLAAIIGGSMEDFARCPGIGERKVKRLHDTFNEPFRRVSKQLRLSDVVACHIGGGQKGAQTVEATKSELFTPPRPSVRDALNAARSRLGDISKSTLEPPQKDSEEVDVLTQIPSSQGKGREGSPEKEVGDGQEEPVSLK